MLSGAFLSSIGILFTTRSSSSLPKKAPLSDCFQKLMKVRVKYTLRKFNAFKGSIVHPFS